MEVSQAQSQVDSATKATAVAAHWADTGEFPAEIETVYSPCICRWDRELAMIAFDGWKDAPLKGLTARKNLIAQGEKMRMNMEDGQDAGKKVKKISKPKVEKEPVELV